MADANSVSPNLATLGAAGWVPNANWGAINGVPVAPQSALWANRAQFQSLGRQVRFTDVGPSESGIGGGNILYWTGTRWKPVGSNVLLDAIDTPNVAAANAAEQQLNPNHVAVNAGLLQDGDRLRILLTASKNNTAETCTIRLRYGPLGTTADPVVATVTTLAGASQSLGIQMELKRLSATTIQKEGSADTSNSFGGASASAFPAAVTVSDMGVNPMFMSVTTQMSVGAEIATLQNFTLDLFATDS
jgi:hypothetical protein